MASKKQKKIIAFDLDGVLCDREQKTGGLEKYHTCFPIQKNIDLMNSMKNKGYYIKIYTSRGMGILDGDILKILDNLYLLTVDQLSKWGAKYDVLCMGKAPYQLLIDDRAINIADASEERIEEFFKNEPEI